MPERRRDPEHLGADQLLDVDRRGEDRFVGVLEAVLDEGAEHRRQGAGEDHRGRDHAGADELDVGDAVDFVDQGRAEAEAEGEQVDDRFEHAGEGRPLPVGAEVGDLAAHHPGDRRRFEPPHLRLGRRPRSAACAHSASSPVSSTKTSSSEAARTTASSGTAPFVGPLGADDRDRRAGRAHRQALPPRRSARTSASRSRRPVDLGGLAAGVLGDQLGRAAAADHLALVHHRDLVGEPLGLLDVVGRHQDRRARALSARRSASRARCGSAGRGRPSARRAGPGCGSWTRPRASSRRRRMPPESSSTASRRRSRRRARSSARSTAAPTSGTR